LKHGGGGGGSSAIAIGAPKMAVAAAPANNMDVFWINFPFMYFGYHDRRMPKPLARLTAPDR
jgi:hypothetical protein